MWPIFKQLDIESLAGIAIKKKRVKLGKVLSEKEPGCQKTSTHSDYDIPYTAEQTWHLLRDGNLTVVRLS